jgi:cobyrinic acid a,c-diamide synthase
MDREEVRPSSKAITPGSARFRSVVPRELVLNRVKSEREAELIQEAGNTVHRLEAVLKELASPDLLLEGAAGAHLVDLVSMTAKSIE